MKLIAPVSLSASLLSVALSSTVLAQDASASQSATVDALLACRSITDATQRLACMDERVQNVAEAMTSGQLVIIERETAQMAETVAEAVVTAQAQIVAFEPWDEFGFDRPRIMPADQARERGNSELEVAEGIFAEVDNRGRVESVRGLEVRSVALNSSGRTVVRLANGQVWRQTDTTRVQPARDRDWEAGVTATVENGSFGSYFMKLSYSRGRFRVERLR